MLEENLVVILGLLSASLFLMGGVILILGTFSMIGGTGVEFF